jgi:hypothetical protein
MRNIAGSGEVEVEAIHAGVEAEAILAGVEVETTC